MKTTTKVAEYRGHDILLTDSLMFQVEFGPDDNAHNEAADEIKAIIDDRLKSEVKAIKLDLPVLTDEGAPATITGLHMGTSNMIGKGFDKEGGRYHETVYPVADWINDALAEAARLRNELGVVNDRLRVVSIDTSMGYGRCSAEDYLDLIEQFKARHAEKLALALAGR